MYNGSESYEAVKPLILTGLTEDVKIILECVLWALKSMGDKGGTIGFLEKKQQRDESLKTSERTYKPRQSIVGTVDRFLSIMITGLYYSGLIHEHPYICISTPVGYEVTLLPLTDSTGFAISLWQVETYTQDYLTELKKAYGLSHLEYVCDYLLTGHTGRNSTFFKIINILLNNILYVCKEKFEKYNTKMMILHAEYNAKFEQMTPQEKVTFLQKVPNELTLDFSSIVGKVLELFFEFSKEGLSDTLRKSFYKNRNPRLDKFDSIFGTESSDNISIGDCLDRLWSAYVSSMPGQAGSSMSFAEYLTSSASREASSEDMEVTTPQFLTDNITNLKMLLTKPNKDDSEFAELLRSKNGPMVSVLEERYRFHEDSIKHFQSRLEEISKILEISDENTEPIFIALTGQERVNSRQVLEFRIEVGPETRKTYVRTRITSGAQALLLSNRLNEITQLDTIDGDPYFSVQLIDALYYSVFPSNVEFFADVLDKYKGQNVRVYKKRVNDADWGMSMDIPVEVFCKGEIKGMLEELFPKEIIDIEKKLEILLRPDSFLRRAVNEVSSLVGNVMKPRQKKTKTSNEKDILRAQEIERRIAAITEIMLKSKGKPSILKNLLSELKQLEAEQQALLKRTGGRTMRKNPSVGGRKTRRIRKKFTLKHKKRSMRKTQRRRNIIK
jgi:hypothetical protein